MKNNSLNSYDLSRIWFDFCFENPEKINPNHSALYFFCIEHCNRLGWKEKFGLPTTMAKEAIGIRSYNTYIKTLHDLVDFGFIKMIEISKNQYSSNIIALSKNDKALDKALDKAFIKHTTKQSESTQQSISSIDKQITNKQITNKQKVFDFSFLENEKLKSVFEKWIEYKKQIKDNYKVQMSIESSFKKLKKYSNDNPLIANEIIENSIANGYKGFFELKNQNNQQHQNQNQNQNQQIQNSIPFVPNPKKKFNEN